MIETRIRYEQSSNTLTIEYKNNLLIDYSDILSDIFAKERENSPIIKNARIDHISSNKINLVIPLKDTTASIVSKNMLRVPQDIVDVTNSILNNFTHEAVRREGCRYEIIPLKNYPIPDIQKDIKAMVNAKRDLKVISDYEDYKNSKDISNISLEQATFDYLTDDYCDIVIAAVNGDLEEVEKLVSGKLKKTDLM